MDILKWLLMVFGIIGIILFVILAIVVVFIFICMCSTPDNCTACNGYPYACPGCRVFKANGNAAGDTPEELSAAIDANYNKCNIDNKESGEFDD